MQPTVPFVDSTQYYNSNARDYGQTTKNLDLSFLYNLFLPYLPKKAKLLDAGCGSGRDTKHFLEQGYEVVAFDGAPAMARYASGITGIDVQHRTFADIDEINEYDGIWASASLIHIKKDELSFAFENLKRALKLGGYWYMSFRKGETDVNEGDRYFNDQTKESLSQLITDLGGLDIVMLDTPDHIRSRRGYKFVIAIVGKVT